MTFKSLNLSTLPFVGGLAPLATVSGSFYSLGRFPSIFHRLLHPAGNRQNIDDASTKRSSLWPLRVYSLDQTSSYYGAVFLRGTGEGKSC